jgi:DEAD/DEAH box helicase domain-containing protein
MDKLKQEHQTTPDDQKELWQGSPTTIALHSLGHQMIFAVPLAFLSSHHDVNFITQKEGNRIVGYFFDTCPGGNGATETIFAHFSQLTTKAHSLATACDCEYGCPRCLMQHSCPQQNQALNKLVGLFLLDAVSKATS